MPENEKSVPDLIMEILNKEGKTFTTVKDIINKMSVDTKRRLRIYRVRNDTQIKTILEPQLEDKFVFNKKGPVLYILVPCNPEDLIIQRLSNKKGKSPKDIARSMPFSKKDFHKIISELISQGRVRLELNDNLEPRLFLIENSDDTKQAQAQGQIKTQNLIPDYESKTEEFIKAFKSLDKGQIFVRICDIRRALDWPREIFDNMLTQLRKNGVIHLYAGDESLMTPDEIQDCFIDENNFRKGTVTL